MFIIQGSEFGVRGSGGPAINPVCAGLKVWYDLSTSVFR